MRLSRLGLLLAAVFIILSVIHHRSSSAIKHSPGVLAPEDPVQEMIGGAVSWSAGDYEITPLARFRITARVLGKKRYTSGREADLSNYDLALGWGPMSDQAVLDKMQISQRGRWYHYKFSSAPIQHGEITRHSGNMHIIAADDRIAERLADIVTGHLVSLAGYLVLVRAHDGWTWASSLSRTDSGAHSCEVLWAEELTIHSDP